MSKTGASAALFRVSSDLAKYVSYVPPNPSSRQSAGSRRHHALIISRQPKRMSLYEDGGLRTRLKGGSMKLIVRLFLLSDPIIIKLSGYKD